MGQRGVLLAKCRPLHRSYPSLLAGQVAGLVTVPVALWETDPMKVAKTSSLGSQPGLLAVF